MPRAKNKKHNMKCADCRAAKVVFETRTNADAVVITASVETVTGAPSGTPGPGCCCAVKASPRPVDCPVPAEGDNADNPCATANSKNVPSKTADLGCSFPSPQQWPKSVLCAGGVDKLDIEREVLMKETLFQTSELFSPYDDVLQSLSQISKCCLHEIVVSFERTREVVLYFETVLERLSPYREHLHEKEIERNRQCLALCAEFRAYEKLSIDVAAGLKKIKLASSKAPNRRSGNKRVSNRKRNVNDPLPFNTEAELEAIACIRVALAKWIDRSPRLDCLWNCLYDGLGTLYRMAERLERKLPVDVVAVFSSYDITGRFGKDKGPVSELRTSLEKKMNLFQRKIQDLDPASFDKAERCKNRVDNRCCKSSDGPNVSQPGQNIASNLNREVPDSAMEQIVNERANHCNSAMDAPVMVDVGCQTDLPYDSADLELLDQSAKLVQLCELFVLSDDGSINVIPATDEDE